MCDFFSFVSDGKGNYYYCDWETRKKITSGELKQYDPDSHTSIAHLSGFNAKQEDKLNKYEYNPFTKKLRVDQINTKDDSKDAEGWVRNLDFNLVCPLLIFKEVINPLSVPPNEVVGEDINNLKEWASIGASIKDSVRGSVKASVGASLWDSVWASVKASVGASLWVSVWASIWASLWDSIWDSVWASLWDSIEDSAWASVRGSVRGSVGVYVSSFFNIKYNFNRDCLLKLYERGFVPSYDGTTWRLHSGPTAEIIYEEELKNV
jgi:hypothetical protein